jgi:uncharacterized protein (DUF1697 family)
MPTYVALLRGVMPTNPSVKSANLKRVFESLGFKDVETVLASGNVVFASASKSAAALETKIERALQDELEFKTTALVRSREQLERLVKSDPFKGVKNDEQTNYLICTFFKDSRPELCTVVDRSSESTPPFMRELEKEHGKEITTRTWKTIGRILKKMGSALAQ